MHVCSAVIQLRLQSRTLKEKRAIVKSILARASNNFNVATAEVDDQDIPGSAILAFATVSQSSIRARTVLAQLEERIVHERPDVEVVAVEIVEC